MTTIKHIQKLSVDIRRLIYQYDPTFRNIYNKVLEEMIYYTFAYRLKHPYFKRVVMTVKKKHLNNPLFGFSIYRIGAYRPYIGETSYYNIESCERWNITRFQDVSVNLPTIQSFMLKMPTILKYFCIPTDKSVYDKVYYDDDDDDER